MPRYLVLDLHFLDLHCGACERGGDPNPPRLARFVRNARGGPIGFQPFTVDGKQVGPYPHQRPDGGVTWQLLCPQGHNKPMRHERIAAALDAIPAGKDSIRRSV